MSTVLKDIQVALTTRLASMSPALATEWENEAYTPASVNTPYQSVNMLPGATENPTFPAGGSELIREVGVFQVKLYYPKGAGTGAAVARADAIRDHFPRGTMLSSNGVNVYVERTPSIAPAMQEGDWYVLPVSIPYFSNVFA